MSVSAVLARLRQPEYTGENRCLPCTAVNVLIAVVLAGLVSAVFTPVVGLVGFLAGLGLIYLRGYLVPGTPTLTKTYFPPWLLHLFGKDAIETVDTPTRSARPSRPEHDSTPQETEPASTGQQTEPADPLVASGVLDADGTLTPEFSDAWAERLSTLSADAVEPADVATMYDANEARETGSNSYVLDGSKSVRWGSTAALVADVAAASLLDERLETWRDYDRDRRQSVLLGLRLCLDRCPDCGEAVTRTQDRVDPCCQRPHLVADAVCESCGAVIADAAVVDDGTTETVHERLLLA